MTNLEMLKKALKSMKLTPSVGNVKGYGSATAKADVVIKEHPSLGFQRVEGKIGFVGDFYSTGLDEKDFMKKLASEYNYQLYKKALDEKNINIASVKRTGTRIEIQCTL